ncbi:MAG TPA: undecaprenyl-diphosphate phosphatase, partial [Gemmatimonadales bacterium]
SSSGHLVLAEAVIGFRPPGLYVEVWLHLATLLSVLVAYWSRIRALVHGLLTRQHEAWRYAGLLLLASVPAAVAGLFFRDFFERSFESGISLGIQFIITGLILWLTKPALERATGERIGAGAALAIGVAQALAILPAISRSGTTIATALWLGIAPGPAAEFSFLMSIIAVAGSGLLEARHIPPGTDLLSAGLVVGFVAALVSGIWAIRFLVALLRSRRFHVFAIYCVAIGTFTILWYAVRR